MGGPAPRRQVERLRRFRFFDCSATALPVTLSILVDWNQDGDWNDIGDCLHRKQCTPEWAVVNLAIVPLPGCSVFASPPIQAGPREGAAWMRVTSMDGAVPPDFPWKGSAGARDPPRRLEAENGVLASRVTRIP